MTGLYMKCNSTLKWVNAISAVSIQFNAFWYSVVSAENVGINRNIGTKWVKTGDEEIWPKINQNYF